MVVCMRTLLCSLLLLTPAVAAGDPVAAARTPVDPPAPVGGDPADAATAGEPAPPDRGPADAATTGEPAPLGGGPADAAAVDEPAPLEGGPADAATGTTVDEANADEPAAADPWNLALGIGFGQQYAGLGANLAGYVRIKGIFSLGAFGSVGLLDFDTCCSDWGFSAGALAAFGWDHRVALALSYGAVWNERERRDDRVVNGITAAVGYELMMPSGFWLRWLAGAAFPTDELEIDDEEVIPSINVGLGWNL